MGKIWTKDAEREQLRKIDALIEETEVGSYIRMAFSGCVKMAKDNIDNDFANSFPEMIAEREKCICDLKQKAIDKSWDHKDDILRLEHERDALQSNLDNAESNAKIWADIAERHMRSIKEVTEQRDALAECVDGLNEIITKQEKQIIELKAKLYDYMMKGAE